ncbi:hypothetical protein pb186bvf_009001 [Paramecium bursaria]
MKGPKFIDQNVVRQVCMQEQFGNHKFKLQNITSDTSLSRKVALQSNDKHQQIRVNKFYTKFQVDLMKEQQIFKENAKILNRIVDIGNSKSQSQLNRRVLTRQSSASSLKSLNYSFRKKEGMKIVEENKRLMQRLERTSSTFRNKEAYLRDFKKTQELKTRISKLSSQNKQKMTKLIQNLSSSQQKYNITAQQTFKRKTEMRFNTAKQPSYQTSSLSKLRIDAKDNILQFPRIK